MDMIVSACRVLASRPRLRLLRAVYSQPGITGQALAVSTTLPVAAVSKHLKLLRGFHLVQAAPQGRYVHYLPGRSIATSNRFLRGLQVLLHDLLGANQLNDTLAQVCHITVAPSWETAFDALVKMFTAYTHLRRLMVLRCLDGHGVCTLEQLIRQVHMSERALHRHLRKLQRRNVVLTQGETPRQWCVAARTGPVGQQRLLTCVLAELRAAKKPRAG